MYAFICFVLAATGGAILYIFPHMEHPGKAVLGMFLLGSGAFLWLFRRKDAETIIDRIRFIFSGLWH